MSTAKGKIITESTDKLVQIAQMRSFEDRIGCMDKSEYEKFIDILDGLPPRRRDVLDRFLAGQTDVEIAQSLKIHEGTVRKHIADLCYVFNIDDEAPGERRSKRADLLALFAKYKPELLGDRAPISAAGAVGAFVTEGESSKATPESSVQPEVPVSSETSEFEFYVEPPDLEVGYQEIVKPGCLLRIQAPPQMGKTSLMSKILDYAKKLGYRTVPLNLREAMIEELENVDRFLQWFCSSVAVMLNVKDSVEEHWSKSLGNSKLKCKSYFEKYLLVGKTPLALAVDEIDLLFSNPRIADEVLGMLRSWHEQAKTREIWKQLRLVLVHTELYSLPIHQSPFNVGTCIQLPELTLKQVQELVEGYAERYNLNWSQTEIEQLMNMVGGHPYLIREALERLRQDSSFDEILQTATCETGLYGDHLRSHLSNLQRYPELKQRYPELKELFKKVVKADSWVEVSESELDRALTLHDVGLVSFENNKVKPRYELYRQYFRKRLTESK